MKDIIIKEIESNYNNIIKIRRTLHQIPEIGFELDKTCQFVYETLQSYGIEPIKIGKNGIVCYIGKGENDKCLLLRCDMDGLVIKEESDIDFKASANMHACGHDLHTTMLLGACNILKKYENKLTKTIKVLFQPAEETLEGAKDMIEHGVLVDVDRAVMLHVISLETVKTGTIIISGPGVIAPASDFFEINILGKSTHGAMPEKGVNPIGIGCEIINSINYMRCNEFGLNDKVLLTIGSFNSGTNNNVIPDKAIIKGTFRCYDESIRHYIKRRINEIIDAVCKVHKGLGRICYFSSCPSLINDELLFNNVVKVLENSEIDLIKNIQEKSTGSEDFSYISQTVPSIMIGVVSKGDYPLHNSKVVFDEEVIKTGVLIYSILGFEDI